MLYFPMKQAFQIKFTQIIREKGERQSTNQKCANEMKSKAKNENKREESEKKQNRMYS